MDPDRQLANAADQMMVHAADRRYGARDWGAAMTLYRAVHDRNPDLSREFALPLPMGHCAVELGDPALLADLPPVAGSGGARESAFLHELRTHAYAFCRAGDFERAAALLRHIAPACPMVGAVYGDGLLERPSARCAALRQHGDSRDPGFIADIAGLSDDIERMRLRHAGMRVLLVIRRFYFNNPDRRCEFADNLNRTAVSYGLAVRELNAHWLPDTVPQTQFPDVLAAAIDDFEPHLILFDDLWATGLSAGSPETVGKVRTVLAEARARFGCRIVKSFPDAWMIEPEKVRAGLGDIIDLVHHCHPGILDRAEREDRARTFCFPYPYEVARPTTPAAAIARASFVGTIYTHNYARLVWWAEIERLGLPVDFTAFLPADLAKASDGQQTDTDYANLLQGYRASINFTRRSTGVKILTGRTLEVPMTGGVLLEEDSFDAGWFLKPGIHYMPFESLPDLQAGLSLLLEDDARCDRIRRDGKAWVDHWFSGDHYWTGVLRGAFGG